MYKSKQEIESRTMKTEIKKREIDGQYVLWGFTVDPTYDPNEVDEFTVPYIPQRWIMLGVYDEYREAERNQKKYLPKKRKQKFQNNHERRIQKGS